jgi:3-hydroxyacyl-[acyl-carrier-protein] dehydratase
VSAATVLDRAAIEARLPHRPPFLFVDRVVALALDATPPALTAEWRVPADADFFRGHYPGNPVTPGVILCEHAFQSAALLLAERGVAFGATAGVPVLARIEKARFRRIVRPDETVVTEIRLTESVGPAAHLAARVTVAGATALELACVLMRTETADGAPA